MWIKCIIECITPDIESGGDIEWKAGEVKELSGKFGSWILTCYDRNFQVVPKPKAKAKAKSKAKAKGKGK